MRLRALLICEALQSSPALANSSTHHWRAKKPRSSRRGSISTMMTPGRLVSVKIIAAPPTRSLPSRSGCRASRRQWAGEQIIEPAFATEMAVLLGAQPVGQSPAGKLDVGVAQRLVLGDVPLEPAALDESLGQVLLRTHLINVDRLAISHVHAVLIEGL